MSVELQFWCINIKHSNQNSCGRNSFEIILSCAIVTFKFIGAYLTMDIILLNVFAKYVIYWHVLLYMDPFAQGMAKHFKTGEALGGEAM